MIHNFYRGRKTIQFSGQIIGPTTFSKLFYNVCEQVLVRVLSIRVSVITDTDRVMYKQFNY